LLEFARCPTPQTEAARANYNSNVLCNKSLSSAAEDKAGERFSVEVQIYRIEVLLRGFPRTQFPALKHFQSYALLSAESKATDAASNKERLDVCHDMCGAVPFFLSGNGLRLA
jgi:hypothetical protein